MVAVKLPAALLLAVLFIVAVVAAPPPALLAGMTANGLQTTVNSVLPSVFAKLKGLPIPDVHTKKDSIKVDITGIHIDSVSYSSFTTSVSGSQLNLEIAGLATQGGLTWKYREEIWPHIPFGGGTADFSVDGGDISVSLQLNTVTAPDGGLKPQLVVSGCNVRISNISVKIHGSIFSWLYDLIIDLFKGSLKSAAADAIKGALVTAVNVKADAILETLSYKINFREWGTLDYSLTGPAQFIPSAGVFYLPFKAEVYQQNSTAECPLPHNNIAYAPSGRMIDLFLDTFALNSGGFVYFNEDVWHLTLDNSNLPPSFPIKLYTNDWAMLIPQLQVVYPNMAMQIVISLDSNPNVETSNGAASITAPFLIDVQVLPTNKPALSAFAIVANITAVLDIHTFEAPAGPALDIQVGNTTDVTFTLRNSTIGNIDFSLINIITSAIIDTVIIPNANKQLAPGFPLPSVDGLSLLNPLIYLQNNIIQLSTDISFKPPAEMLL